MPRKPRVALVLFGQPRFVELGWSSVSHKMALRGADLSVFGHVWFDPQCDEYESAPWSGLGKVSITSDAIAHIERQYPKIKLLIEKPRLFDVNTIKSRLPSDALATAPDFERRKENLPNTASHCYSIHKALELANEVHLTEPFDYYVLSRFDTVLSRFPRWSTLRQNYLYISNHHDAFPDMIFVGDPKSVNSVDGWRLFETAEIDENSLVGEEVKKRAYETSLNKPPLKPINLTSHAIRSGNRKSLFRFSLNVIHYELAKAFRTVYVPLVLKFAESKRQRL